MLVRGLGLNIQGWGFKVQGTGCRGFRGVWGLRFRGFRAWRVGGGSVKCLGSRGHVGGLRSEDPSRN